jgi:SAM-dependent methyltransferase
VTSRVAPIATSPTRCRGVAVEGSGSMTCRICTNSLNNATYRASEMMFGLGDVFEYFQCGACGCLQITEFPPDMARYYPPHYYSFQWPGALPRGRVSGSLLKRVAKGLRDQYAVCGRGVAGRFLYRLFPNEHLRDIIQRHLPDPPRPQQYLRRRCRILDVGCGNGRLLLALHEVGFRRLLGIDAYLDADVEYPGGLTILKRTIHEISGLWDVVMFHHSFEHVADPIETLRSTARRLRPGGICVARIPVVSSHAWERYGVRWVQLDAPRHFFLHSVNSMRVSAEKAGLVVEKIVWDSTGFQFWGSEQYVRGIPLLSECSYFRGAERSVFSREQIEAFEEAARSLNAQGRGDQAAFYLRKPTSSTAGGVLAR